MYSIYYGNKGTSLSVKLRQQKCTGYRVEVLISVVMKSSIFRDKKRIFHWNQKKFRRKCRFYLQGRRMRQAKKLAWSRFLVSRWLLALFILGLWRWRWHVPPKHRLTFNRLHGVIFQKTELFNSLHSQGSRLYSSNHKFSFIKDSLLKEQPIICVVFS
jgi:hypothetical protein